MSSHKQKTSPETELPTGEQPLHLEPGADATATTSALASEANPLAKDGTGSELELYDYSKDAGAGMENIGSDEYSIPFVKIVQTNSPTARPVAEGGLGAPVGSILNTATSEFYDGKIGVDFVPCYRGHNYVERMPFEQGGQFIGIRAEDDPMVADLVAKHGKFKKLPGPNGAEIIEAYYLYWLMLIDNTVAGRVLVPFPSTQIKKYKGFINRQLGIKYPQRDRDGRETLVNPPMWSHIWHACTVPEQKDQNHWKGWRITLKEEPPIKSRLRLNDPIYVQGREFYDLVKAGITKVDYSKMAEREPGEEDEEIPM